jgi:hypothetical protein
VGLGCTLRYPVLGLVEPPEDILVEEIPELLVLGPLEEVVDQ